MTLAVWTEKERGGKDLNETFTSEEKEDGESQSGECSNEEASTDEEVNQELRECVVCLRKELLR